MRTDVFSYAELQATSNYSFLRGASHPDELVKRAQELGYSALAITDRNSLAGIVRAHVAAQKAGLRYLVGCRLDLQSPALSPLEGPSSFLCYPKDRAAYGRLCRLLSHGKTGNTPKGECWLTFDDVIAHRDGQVLIALAPPSWLSPTTPIDVAVAALRATAQALAPTPLYLSASATYSGDDKARLRHLALIAEASDVPLVVTGDVHYHDPSRRPLQDVVSALRERTTIEKAGYLLHPNEERHLKTLDEIAQLFSTYEQALKATQEIAELCQFSLNDLRYNYPNEPVPPGATPQQHLTELTFDGARLRYPTGIPHKIKALLDKELALIAKLQYAPYFLTVHDIVRWARSQDILCQGRGSAANSAVCFCLFITSIDPTEIDLLFERFLSEERQEPPDIDVDFEHERREDVMQYIYARYGRHRSGIAATVITYRSRSAIRDVAKAMGLSEDVQNTLAASLSSWSSKSVPHEQARQAGLDPADPLIAQTIDLARQLIGFPRHLSQHVGGFVLTEDPLVEMVPVGNAAMKERTFVEWDKDDLAALGLLKIDVLALGMLTCLHKALKLMADHHGDRRDLADFFPAADEATFDMLCQADSVGVFQVESRAQMNMLPRLKPRCFYDLVIEVAIVRPGPIQGDMVHPYLRRRDGLEPVDYPAPSPDCGPPDELERILKKTLGVPLFQEQAMRIAIEAARFSPDEANELRHAMATFRRRGTIERLQNKMIERMVGRGYDPDFAARCFNQVKGFGEYGFPESHSASFALLVYVSSWIKCHYPAVFCAALLNAQPMGFYAPAQVVRDARAHGVEVRPPDVNLSDWDTTLEPSRHSHKQRAVRLGLRQIKGLSETQADALSAARQRIKENLSANELAFVRLEDLYLQAGLSPATLGILAAADAFRSLGLDRRAALWAIKALPDTQTLPLFASKATADHGEEPTVSLPSMSLGEHVVDDYQALRLSLKAHPLSFLRASFTQRHIKSADDLRHLPHKASVSVTGLIIVRQRPGTASGVVFMTMEDETGIINAIVWPKVMEKYRAIVMASRMIMARGRLQKVGDILHLIVTHLEDWSHELLALSRSQTELAAPLARADEVVRPASDPRVADPLAPINDKDQEENEEQDLNDASDPKPDQDPDNGFKDQEQMPLIMDVPVTPRAAAKIQPASPKLMRKWSSPNKTSKERLPPFSYGRHPRSVRNLIPKSRDFR